MSQGNLVIGMVSDPFSSQIEVIKTMRQRGFRVVSMTEIVCRDMSSAFNGTGKTLTDENKRHQLSCDMSLSASKNIEFKKWFGSEVLTNIPVYCQPNTPATMALMWREFREKSMKNLWISSMTGEINRTDDDRPIFVSEIGNKGELDRIKEMGGKVWLGTKIENELTGWWGNEVVDAVIYLDDDVLDQIESRTVTPKKEDEHSPLVMGDY